MKPLDSGSPGHEIIEDELHLFGRVSAALAAISTATVGAPDYDEALINLRDQMGEAKPEDLPALVEQMTRVAAIAQRYGKGRDLPVDPTSPYFAHMRLAEVPAGPPSRQRAVAPAEKQRDVLIGKRGYIDRARRVQIVDWRNAPVSRIYYRYEEGDDYEESFGSRPVEGRLLARRAVTIDAGALRRIGCPQGTFAQDGEGAWVEAMPVGVPELKGGQGKAARPPKVLSKGNKKSKLGIHSGSTLRADKHLPEIAALIDPQQFDLITHPESGLVVLQGGAGTGKTTVALHRVAYLNFQAPQRFRPDRMLVIVPSQALVSYVQRVLPGLGVRGVRVVTAEQWFERTRRKLLESLAGVRYSDDTPAAVLRVKKHPLVLELLRDYVERQTAGFGRALEAALFERPGGELVLDEWRKHAGSAPIPRLLATRGFANRGPRLAAVTRQTADSTLRRLLRRARDLVTDWSDALTDRALLAAHAERLAPGEITARQLDSVVQWCTKQAELAAPEERADGERERPSAEPYLTANGRNAGGDDEDTRARLDRPDDALLLYLCLLKRGELRSPRTSAISYEHLVVDEAQDLALGELKVLLDATTSAQSVTLAGDVAQRLVFDNGFSDWETLLERLGVSVATNTTLELGYRSTGEVMALANSLLDGGALNKGQAAQPTRSGAPVELHRFNDQGELVAMLGEALRTLGLREPLASVALIARHRAQARLYADALRLAEVANIRLVTEQDFSFRPGIEATDVSQVKGLEFDYVILLDVTASNYPNTVESRHLLHIAATRAAHQLWLIAVGRPSLLLPPTL